MGDYIDVVITQPDAGMIGRGNGAATSYGGGPRRSGGDRPDRDRFGGGGNRYGTYGR